MYLGYLWFGYLGALACRLNRYRKSKADEKLHCRRKVCVKINQINTTPRIYPFYYLILDKLSPLGRYLIYVNFVSYFKGVIKLEIMFYVLPILVCSKVMVKMPMLYRLVLVKFPYKLIRSQIPIL